MKKIEHTIEAIILASRWLLVVFYLGLAFALLLYALSFGKKLSISWRSCSRWKKPTPS